MNSAKAQLIYDQLLDDLENGREPSLSFIQVIETITSSNDPYESARRLGPWVRQCLPTRVDRPVTSEESFIIWGLMYGLGNRMVYALFSHVLDRKDIKEYLQLPSSGYPYLIQHISETLKQKDT